MSGILKSEHYDGVDDTAAECETRLDDIEEGKKVEIEKGTTYVFDRGYINFNWRNGAYFVTKPIKTMAFINLTETIKETEKISYQLVLLKSRYSEEAGKK